MKTDLLKELVGEKINQCTQENFEKGYDPILAALDEYEAGFELSYAEESILDNYKETEEFLSKMSLVKPTDENYSTIYVIDFYCNIFYYSKNEADILFEVWKTSDEHYNGGKNRFWFYHSLDSQICSKLQEMPQMNRLFANITERFIPSIKRDLNADICSILNEIKY